MGQLIIPLKLHKGSSKIHVLCWYHKKIKACRQNAGMSQEKVAELVGVSRQAVTKREANQSAPNTENLFKLAEILGTTVDLLLASQETGTSPA